MTSLSYFAESVPWILAGLVVGFFMGRSTRAVEAIADAVQEEGDAMPGRRRIRFTGNGVIIGVLVALGIATATQAYVQGDATSRVAEENRRLGECQKAYISGFADALDARSTASAEAQDALDDFLFTVAKIAPSPEGQAKFQDAFNEYVKKRAEAKKAQAENPYPPAPRDVCKEDG